ncbi:MAG: hypothetical protein JNK64_01020 [Myxococcales bacterium]|nr:hypothetical protein [Myxococcales bacterium]
MSETAAEQWPLRRGSLIYPTPVAIACGRVLRARTAAESVSACLKAAEVLTRYLAAVAVASFASRDDNADAMISELSGNLSFGHFLTTVQEISSAQVQHPAQQPLRYAFRGIKKDKGSGATNDALVRLLTLRNRLGHELAMLDETRAGLVEADDRPRDVLHQALVGAEALLSFPLFVVEHQEWVKKDAVFVLRRLLLMGESLDPAPTIAVVQRESSVESLRVPYAAIGEACIQLPPWILWGIDERRKNLSLLFLDCVEEKKIVYCTLDGTKQHGAAHHATALRQFFGGAVARPFDKVLLADGRNFAQEWADTREHIEDSGRRQGGVVDWQAFDPIAVEWYATILDKAAEDYHALIRERLLDGRTSIGKNELRQLVLLFGTKANVRATLGRDVLDIRVIDDETKRPRQRELVESENVLFALRRAVSFLSEALAKEALVPEDLRQVDGEVDYLTIREMLVNQIIHQDYCDSRTSAQIELYADKITLMNAGYSLVPMGELLGGGMSQCRNPLIARALRSIGFAELSGSGIRALVRALRTARRKAPHFTSDEKGNTFKVTLEWTEEAPDQDAFWMELVGARLTSEQARVLNTLAELPSATLVTLESTTQIRLEELTKALDFLVFQVLVERDDANYRLAAHLREKLG